MKINRCLLSDLFFVLSLFVVFSTSVQAQIAPPVIAKSFSPGGIQPNGISTLTVTITNPAANAVPLQGVAFTDNFPANLVVATPNGLTNSCGGTATASAGSGSQSLTGGTIPTNSSCTVTANVTSPFTGSYLNSTGPVSSTNGGTGGAASATLFVAFPPTISKLFLPDTVAQNGTTLLSFTIQNPNSNSTPPNNDVTLTGITFTDALPAGLAVAASPNLSSNCGGTVTAVPGSTSITLTGGGISPAVGLLPGSKRSQPVQAQAIADGVCFISFLVTPGVTGTLNNNTGPISANESGAGATSNTAGLTVTAGAVAVPPTLVKAFGAAAVGGGLSTSLTFTITNPNSSTELFNTSFTDVLPSGLVVASPNGLTGSCVNTNGASITANPGSSTINVSALNLPASSSCSFAVNVAATSGGTKNNVTGNISATFSTGVDTFQTVTGGTATASITVVAPPTISKAFNPTAIALNEATTLTFTITNPAVNTAALTGVSFTDTLPSGTVIATPNGLNNTCGGTVTAVSGTGSVSLTGGTVAAGSNCTITVSVTGAALGDFTNTTSAVTSTNGGIGNVGTASVTVQPVATAVPALTEWGIVIMGIILGASAIYLIRRIRTV